MCVYAYVDLERETAALQHTARASDRYRAEAERLRRQVEQLELELADSLRENHSINVRAKTVDAFNRPTGGVGHGSGAHTQTTAASATQSMTGHSHQHQHQHSIWSESVTASQQHHTHLGTVASSAAGTRGIAASTTAAAAAPHIAATGYGSQQTAQQGPRTPPRQITPRTYHTHIRSPGSATRVQVSRTGSVRIDVGGRAEDLNTDDEEERGGQTAGGVAVHSRRRGSLVKTSTSVARRSPSQQDRVQPVDSPGRKDTEAATRASPNQRRASAQAPSVRDESVGERRNSEASPGTASLQNRLRRVREQFAAHQRRGQPVGQA